jgi:hypothetical protein
MNDKELTDVGKEVAKRGRPKGTGGNKRKDLSWSGNQNLRPGDMGRYLRHALAAWDLPPIDISDEKQVEERIIWYFNHCIEDDMKPTVSGICSALGVNRQTFYQWGIGECRKSTHTGLVKKAREILENLWESWMMDGKINPVVGIFLGKNHFGYADKQDIIVTPNNPLGDARDPEEVRQRYLDSVVVDELPSDDGEETAEKK